MGIMGFSLVMEVVSLWGAMGFSEVMLGSLYTLWIHVYIEMKVSVGMEREVHISSRCCDSVAATRSCRLSGWVVCSAARRISARLGRALMRISV